MRTDMRGKDFVTLMDYTGEELQTILDVAFDLKRQNAMGARARAAEKQDAGHDFCAALHPARASPSRRA